VESSERYMEEVCSNLRDSQLHPSVVRMKINTMRNKFALKLFRDKYIYIYVLK
jgi:hypothetical protein